MHEMSIAMNIIEIASAAAQAEGARVIGRIELEIGTMAGIMLESLEFCFEAAAKGTLAEGAVLDITSIPAEGLCTACNKISAIDSLAAQCSHCGAYLLSLLTGNDLKIKAITVDEE
ncbi:MAG: hydrogenase maturation nickel metallochaperone HypA [Desulfobulbaceae bacterium]|nr:hydrogenase maturation nickel metallochaperone HypA [Desulfobulbaceae bacterium]